MTVIDTHAKSAKANEIQESLWHIIDTASYYVVLQLCQETPQRVSLWSSYAQNDEFETNRKDRRQGAGAIQNENDKQKFILIVVRW
jgi:hypothetical protein